MRVNNQNVNGAASGGETASAQRARRSHKISGTAAASESRSPTETTGAASTEISARAKEMAHAKEIATSAPDVREARIAELKKRIAAHQYNVKPEDVADRMVEEHTRVRGRT